MAGKKIIISEQYQKGDLISIEYLFEKKNGTIDSVQYDAEGEVIAIAQTAYDGNVEETWVLTIYAYDTCTNSSEFTCEMERKIFKDGRLVKAFIAEFSKDDRCIEEDMMRFEYEGDYIAGYCYNDSTRFPLTAKTAEWI